MKGRVIGYWVVTALVALSFVSGGFADLLHVKDAAEGMAHLGYPGYFMTILGVWKIGGALAIVLPRFPRLKEWAYAGMIFDLTGATASHIAVHDDVRHILVPLVIAGFVVASWALRPASRRV